MYGAGKGLTGTDDRSPRYVDVHAAGLLRDRVEAARQRLSACVLCPRVCRTPRLEGEVGACGGGRDALVSSWGPHYGEENVLRGTRGSGTVFFGGCSMSCVFCQNFEVSQFRRGIQAPPDALACIFMDLQRRGCHNLNLVTPSHVIAQVLEALELAIPQGFRLPLVYNSSGYDSVPSLKLLDGIVDIYMPDWKYGDSSVAEKYSGVKSYWQVARAAFSEMHRQVGDLVIEAGLAKRGLLIRHLVLPRGIAGSKAILDFIATEISRDSWINIMAQYHPAYRARDYPELSRAISGREHEEVVQYARSLGLYRGIPLDTRA